MYDVTFPTIKARRDGERLIRAYADIGILIYSAVDNITLRITAVSTDFLTMSRPEIERKLAAHALSFALTPRKHRKPTLIQDRKRGLHPDLI